MKLKVKGNPQKVMNALGTNVPMVAGQVIYAADDFKMRVFAAQNPDLVEIIEDVQTEEKSMVKPQKNKMMKKGNFFKSK